MGGISKVDTDKSVPAVSQGLPGADILPIIGVGYGYICRLTLEPFGAHLIHWRGKRSFGFYYLQHGTCIAPQLKLSWS